LNKIKSFRINNYREFDMINYISNEKSFENLKSKNFYFSNSIKNSLFQFRISKLKKSLFNYVTEVNNLFIEDEFVRVYYPKNSIFFADEVDFLNSKLKFNIM
jgi:hypothetical protein